MSKQDKSDLPKLRNMIALHAWKRKSGAHGKSKKAQRRQDKIELKTQDSSE